jgi:class 3 adenylate cyclase
MGDQVRQQQVSIIGEGQGVYSFVHIDDAAGATAAALECPPGSVQHRRRKPDGPARAIRCACRIRDEVRTLGLEVRSGLHDEVVWDKIGGIAVHIGARVAAAEPGEVLVSSTVKDLVAGSGIAYRNAVSTCSKGLPG